MNKYINEINTKIKKRKYVSGATHIVANDDILLDYKKYNIETEEVYINGNKASEIYQSSLGPVIVVNFKPQNDDLKIMIDYNNRIAILKSLTVRLLIDSVLSKYFGLKASDFYTSVDKSSFLIDGIIFDKDAIIIKDILEKNINEYIKYAVDINQSEDSSEIEGLHKFENLPYTVSNLSELNEFIIDSYEINNSIIKFYYSVS